jgi:ribonucleotide reductase beta subunit family protein with ferritin-like domain
MDPILNEQSSRLVLFPIADEQIWKTYKTQVDCFWRAEEIDLSKDRFDQLTDNEKYFISHILAFFAAADGVVLENLAARFLHDVQLPEARSFYGFQLMMEGIHAEVYSILIDTYIRDTAEKNKLLNGINEFPCIKLKNDWALKWVGDESSFATRLVAFACVEGILFSGSFAAIFWVKKRGLLPGLCFSNELIARDEALHCEFAVLLYNKLLDSNKISKQRIHEIIKGAVDVEKKFICEALPCRLVGMNSNSMSQYIEFVADRLSTQLGCGKIYDAQNPFDFMELISCEQKTNFFEAAVSSYALAEKSRDGAFDFDAKF